MKISRLRVDQFRRFRVQRRYRFQMFGTFDDHFVSAEQGSTAEEINPRTGVVGFDQLAGPCLAVGQRQPQHPARLQHPVTLREDRLGVAEVDVLEEV